MADRRPTHDVAAGKSRDEKSGPRPLRGVPAVDDVIKGGRCPDRFVLYRVDMPIIMTWSMSDDIQSRKRRRRLVAHLFESYAMQMLPYLPYFGASCGFWGNL